MSLYQAQPYRRTEAGRLFKALADDTRLGILRLLALTDLRAGEIAEQVCAPQNAVSYHLKQLRALGLLRDRRGDHDARDIYYSADLDRLRLLFQTASDSIHPGVEPRGTDEEATGEVVDPVRILFLCTHNSARSQLAEAIARKRGGDSVQAFSAGSIVSELHPLTVSLLAEWGIDMSGHYSKTMDRFVGEEFDYIITTCDSVRESCPVFPGDPKRIHWSFPDPKAIDDPDQRLRAFSTIRNELDTRVRYLLNLPHPRTGERIRLRPSDAPAE